MLILLGKEGGFSLEQTRLLLTISGDRETRRELYRRHSEELRQRIAAAGASLAIVEHAARCTADDALACPELVAKVAGRLPERLR